jgi:hypothetical protein
MVVALAILMWTTAGERPAAAPPAAPTQPAGSHQHGDHGKVRFTADMVKQLLALQVLFAKYETVPAALSHGYAFVGPCISDPVLGGMGDHYSRDAEDDFGRGDGTLAVERPQFLLYAPQRDGSRRLAALDYTVPYEKWHSEKPPEFFGIPFTRNDGFGVWMFHIWLFQPNPAGIFANFNPRVPQC